ncbi:MAG TPA: glycosyltransferase family 4 protein [Methanothermococcus okinawensis]|uniref:Glycosyltransferase family 4 protein n=1 Tax=Methanothermococcus okinawensis TaxID=155863 RepID=A0A832ZBU6_9EURY|nr:glycosyltransferase family 4 protein [Methanothermococcus okinawensis]
MNILMPTIFHPYSGGITYHVENIIRHLTNISPYNFHILNYNFQGQLKKLPPNTWIHKIRHINKIRGPSYTLMGYLLGKKLIEKYNIHIIHSHYAFPQGFLGALLSRKYNIPHVLTLHGSDVMLLSKHPLGKVLFNYALKHCDKIICVSRYLKEQLPRAYQNKSEVIYNGVDSKVFYDEGIDEDYGLFVGSFVPQKGLYTLIEAVKDIDFNFKFIGDGPHFKDIKEYIERKGIKNIELLGRKDQEEVAKYLRRCSFLVLPSISEGLGMTVLEAMASGKCVIGSKVGGIPELILDNYNGFLFEVNNVEMLREKIELLVNNKGLRKRLGRNGKEFSKRFSWEGAAKRLDAIYRELRENSSN